VKAMEYENNKKLILIIEDDIPLLNILTDELCRVGYTVLQAKDGESGLAVALLERPTLILLDVIMPKIDGLTVLKKIREENEWGKNVSVILLTNISLSREIIDETIDKDKSVKYIIKSNITMKNVVEKITEFINKS
jgi:CheY-like chemotaxis protein